MIEASFGSSKAIAGMRNKSILLSVGLGASLLTIALIVAFSHSEPSYAGKPLSFWIDQLPARLVMTNSYAESYPAAYATIAEAKADEARLLRASAEARKAVKALGRQCLPSLMHRLNTRDDSVLSGRLVGWGLKLKLLKLTSRAARSAAQIRGQALTGLFELGPDASPAIPDLLALAKSRDPGIRAAACHALERLAPDELKRVHNE